jgi:hypothetical protein
MGQYCWEERIGQFAAFGPALTTLKSCIDIRELFGQ